MISQFKNATVMESTPLGIDTIYDASEYSIECDGRNIALTYGYTPQDELYIQRTFIFTSVYMWAHFRDSYGFDSPSGLWGSLSRVSLSEDDLDEIFRTKQRPQSADLYIYIMDITGAGKIVAICGRPAHEDVNKTYPLVSIELN